MKTFKLKMLEVMVENGDIKDIPLLDGLIINREDEDNFWLIEAYIDQSHEAFFLQLQQQKEEFKVRVKITKETNEPAIFRTTIISLNHIGDHMNVLFQGIIVN